MVNSLMMLAVEASGVAALPENLLCSSYGIDVKMLLSIYQWSINYVG
jgi:hypothetical protein